MGLRDVLEHNQILPKEPTYIYPSHAKNETIKRLNFTKKVLREYLRMQAEVYRPALEAGAPIHF